MNLTEAETSSLLARVHALEVSQRRWRWTTSIAAIFAIALLGASAYQQSSPSIEPVIRAHEFRVIDEEGRLRGSWHPDLGIIVGDESGEPRVIIQDNGPGGAVVLSARADEKEQATSAGTDTVFLGFGSGTSPVLGFGSKEHQNASFGIEPDGSASLKLFGDRGQRAMTLRASALALHDGQGRVRLSLTVAPDTDAPMIVLSDQEYRDRIQLGLAQEKESPYFNLLGEREVRMQLSVNSDSGDPLVVLTDQAGRERIQLGFLAPLGLPGLLFADTTKKVVDRYPKY